MMRFIIWFLIKLGLRKPDVNAVKVYQDASLKFLTNLHAFKSSQDLKFKKAES